MNRTLSIALASAGSAALASAIVINFNANHLDKQLEVERLRAQHAQTNNHFASVTAGAAGLDFTTAAENSVNAVVHVKTTFQVNGGYYSFDPIRHFLFGDGMQQQAPRFGAGAGSGVLISDDGYIVTNNHVINGASKIEVSMNDNRNFEATVVGTDPNTDLALLKVEGENLPRIQFGNSDQLRVGEWVLAVGNPFNLASTVTAGIVSAKGRDINILANSTDGTNAVESFIQTDAAVNPGNSGGALVNLNGDLVGINAAIKSNTGSYTGYSFAIPVNLVVKVVEDLIEFGSVQRGYLGVSIRNVDQELQELEHLSSTNGIYVSRPLEEGAALEAGIESGDVIVKIGDITVRNITEMQEQIGRYRPGDKVLVTVDRKGTILELPVVLRNKHGNTSLNEPVPAMSASTLLGANYRSATSDELEPLGLEGGVVITKVGAGKLSAAGVNENFIVTAIDQQPIADADDFKKAVESKSGGVLMEGVYPNGKRAFYGFGL